MVSPARGKRASCWVMYPPTVSTSPCGSIDLGKFKSFAQLVEGIGAGHAKIFAVLDEIGIFYGVKLIVDLADQLFDDIFERDDAEG